MLPDTCSLSDLRPLDAPALDRADAFNARDFVDGYEFRGDGGDHTPTNDEHAMLEDFGNGLISEFAQGMMPKAPAPDHSADHKSQRPDDYRRVSETLEAFVKALASIAPALGHVPINRIPLGAVI